MKVLEGYLRKGRTVATILDERPTEDLLVKKSIDYYLEGYENEPDRYCWGDLDEPKGRELL
ncbi:MAG: hypothetical protein LBE35_11405 [Clostridiales bacterium]|jgi:hypothetical protein|nr:hypothetical protein [Clostridiales bacterium]